MGRHERIAAELHAALVERAIGNDWRGTSRRNVPIDEVRRSFGMVYRRMDGDDDTVTVIQKCLRVLCEQGLATPLKETDREKVPLPVGIWLHPTAARAAKKPPPMPPWHPELYDLADDWPTTTDKGRARYSAINRWLMSNPDLTLVPLRERALEIFGMFGSESDFDAPEKALDRVTSGPLFGDPGRLLEVLRAIRIPPPLLTRQPLEEVGRGYLQRVGKGDLLLVVENSATWWSVVHALPPRHNVGHIAWGLGASFIASVRSIADRHEVAEIRYFGDLDVSGVRIPRSASRTASADSLPPVRPAYALYADLLAVGRSWRGKEVALDQTRANELVDWLDMDHRRPTAELLTSGRRIAQEWVGFRHLSQTENWHQDLV